MRDETDLVNLVKNISTNANKQSKPVDFYFGVVTSVNPLIIEVDGIKTKQLITFKNTYYEVSEKVALLRVLKGKKYLVLGVIN